MSDALPAKIVRKPRQRNDQDARRAPTTASSPPYHQQDLADRIPQATLLRVPAGHGLPAENPALLTAKVAEHLDQAR
ncbi:hypothetical protein AB0L00_10220 [Actinoallomurus sp. NPDC052308]|uniref:alpha/beta fold hydrolase n=1 Tax=Actinoallomurus sp. NPDC052308 TaxID=3155530 RepID=UPI003425F067